MTWRVHKKRCVQCKALVELGATTAERWRHMSLEEKEKAACRAARAEVLCADCDPDAGWREAFFLSDGIKRSIAAKKATEKRKRNKELEELGRIAAAAIDAADES